MKSIKVYLLALVLVCIELIGNNAYAQNENITIKAYAPNAKSVRVNGMFGSWGFGNINREMSSINDSLWEVTLNNVSSGFHYYSLIINDIPTVNPIGDVFVASNFYVNGIEVPGSNSDICSLKEVPHGIIRTHFYDYNGGNNNIKRRCHVYMPPGYDSRKSTTYPVLYLQHGNGENEFSWIEQGKINLILDNLIAAGKAEPMFVVMDNGMTANYPSLFLDALRETIELNFKTKNEKQYRAVAGLSMGGFQAGGLVFNNQDYFSFLGIFGSSVSFSSSLASTINDNLELLWSGFGTSDEFGSGVRSFHNRLVEFDVNHVVTEYSGAHEWKVWQNCAYNFIQLLFKPYEYGTTSAISENTQDHNILIYPNPTFGQVTVYLPIGFADKKFMVELANKEGRILAKFSTMGVDLEHSISEVLTDVFPGFYLLSLNSGNTLSNFKILRKE